MDPSVGGGGSPPSVELPEVLSPAAELREKGFVILPAILTRCVLDVMREECDFLRNQICARYPNLSASEIDAETDCVVDPLEMLSVSAGNAMRIDRSAYLDVRMRHYFKTDMKEGKSACLSRTCVERIRAVLEDSLFSSLPQRLAQALECDLDEIRFFNEHYVCRSPHSNVTFRWHTDANEQLAMCVDPSVAFSVPYYSLWIPLDDITRANGPLRVIPGSHVPCNDVTDWANGCPEPCSFQNAEEVCVEAGDAVLFSSRLWHGSGPNETSSARRVYYVQYSLGAISDAVSRAHAPLRCAIPCEVL
eukprot:Rmarinus@m.17107